MRLDYSYRPWTGDIVDHITSHPRCGVWAAMGSGKTGATLTALDHLELIDPIPGPTLIIAPRLVARDTWPNELAKWSHLERYRMNAIVGSVTQRKAALRDDTAQFYTVNWESLPWLCETLGNDWPFRKIVADEATKLKGFRLKQGALRPRKLAKRAWVGVDRFIELTGTPAPNGYRDLWGQGWFLDRGDALGRTFSAFDERWFRLGYNGFSYEILPGAKEQIDERLAELCLTVDPRDYVSIDKPIITKVPVLLDAKSRALYTDMERKLFVELSNGQEVEAFNAAAKSSKCAQIANGFIFTDHPRYEALHDAKLDALEQVLDEANGMPVICSYAYVPDAERIKKRFPFAKLPDELGSNLEREWNSGRHKLLIAHPASLGHGLSLQDAGNILVFYSMTWNFEHHDQMIERIGPMRQFQAGHDRAVFLYYLLAQDTVDEMMFLRHETKREVQDLLLEAMKLRY